MSIEAMLETILATVQRIEAQQARTETRVDAIAAITPPALVTVERYAELSGHCRATIRRWCKDGKIPSKRAGHRWLVDASAIRPVSADEIAAAARKARE